MPHGYNPVDSADTAFKEWKQPLLFANKTDEELDKEIEELKRKLE